MQCVCCVVVAPFMPTPSVGITIFHGALWSPEHCSFLCGVVPVFPWSVWGIGIYQHTILQKKGGKEASQGKDWVQLTGSGARQGRDSVLECRVARLLFSHFCRKERYRVTGSSTMKTLLTFSLQGASLLFFPCASKRVSNQPLVQNIGAATIVVRGALDLQLQYIHTFLHAYIQSAGI